MDEEFLREVADQLRKPKGEFGKEVADKMNVSNYAMNLVTINSLEISDNDTVLEIGMANGRFVPHVLEKSKNVHYVGIDYSEDMISLARDTFSELNTTGKVEFKLGDVHSLPLSSCAVDKIFTVNTIYFWEDINLAFEECRRVLKPNGFFAIAIRPKGCLQKYPSTQFNFKQFEIQDIEELFTSHGFEIHKTIHDSEPETEVIDTMIVPEFAVIVGKKTT